MNPNDLIRQVTRLQRQIDNLIKPEVPRWADWTPTVTQSGSVTVTVTVARYAVSGRTAYVQAYLTITGSGSAGNAITIGGLPTIIQPTNNPSTVTAVGTGIVVDQGTATYGAVLVAASTSTYQLRSTSLGGLIGINPSFALANTDVISFQATYER